MSSQPRSYILVTKAPFSRSSCATSIHGSVCLSSFISILSLSWQALVRDSLIASMVGRTINLLAGYVMGLRTVIKILPPMRDRVGLTLSERYVRPIEDIL